MPIESQVDPAVVPSPSVDVNQAHRKGLAPNHRLENRLARIGDDIRVHPASFQKPEDDLFHRRHGLSFPGYGADRKPGEG